MDTSFKTTLLGKECGLQSHRHTYLGWIVSAWVDEVSGTPMFQVVIKEHIDALDSDGKVPPLGSSTLVTVRGDEINTVDMDSSVS